jgi:hypothetical protein
MQFTEFKFSKLEQVAKEQTQPISINSLKSYDDVKSLITKLTSL